jgi:hypothetical protein
MFTDFYRYETTDINPNFVVPSNRIEASRAYKKYTSKHHTYIIADRERMSALCRYLQTHGEAMKATQIETIMKKVGLI